MATDEQLRVCVRFGVEPQVPNPGSHLGIALQTRGRLPLNAVRHAPEGGTCGWYIWWGEGSVEDDFFQAVCVEHIADRCPEAVPYLALPPGWAFQLAPGHEDVWERPEAIEP